MAEAASPFLWGSGGSKDSISRRRQMAEALMKSGIDYSPVAHPLQGLARLSQALLGAYDSNQLDKQEKASNEALATALSGALAPSASPAVSTPAAASSVPTFAGGKNSTAMVMPEIKDGIKTTAASLGISPIDLATAISYETAGTFDPTKAGPSTQWGQHRGLIQFGEPQAKQFGVDWNNPVASQLGPNGAVAAYLKNAGVQPGMGLMDIYSAINAGGVGRYKASDANNGGAPGTVADKVNQQMAGHRAKAQALFADLPAPGASPVAMETGQQGFAVPEQPAPAMSGATFNAITNGMGNQPLSPVFQSESLSQPWMGTALQAPEPAQPQMVQAPLPPARPNDLADLPAEGAVPTIGQMPPPVPAAPPVGVDPNSNDAGSRLTAAGSAGEVPAVGGDSAFAGLARALTGGSTPAASSASPAVQQVAQAVAPQSPAATGAAPSSPLGALAVALVRSGNVKEGVALAQEAMKPINGVTMGDRLVDPRTGRVIADFSKADGSSRKYGLNPIYGTDKNGNPVMLQAGEKGDAVQTKLPDGVTLATGVDKIDAGTHYVLLDRRTGQPVSTIPKNVAGTEQAKVEGKTAGERVAEAPQAQLTYQSAVGTLDRLATEAKALRDHPGLKGITGWQSVFPNAAGGQAANAQAKLETLKSQIGFGVLQAMREASKTGGALGSVSDAEGKRLENNLAALAQSQSLDEFQKNLNQIVDYAETSKGRLGEAYRQTYPNAASAPSPAPTSNASGWQDVGGVRIRRKQ